MSAQAKAGVVTLLTDFGLGDPFVGIMKGVMLRLAPGLELIDLSHGIPAQDVEAASFTLAHSFSWFAPGTVHVCVVDPGVGSARAAVAVRAHGYTFVGPDNGVFNALAEGDPHAAARRIEPAGLGLQLRSRTFHGRDLFAPVAALLASGRRQFEELGPVHELMQWSQQKPQRSEGGATGKVVLVDHFGNIVDYNFTSDLEQKLDDIADGEKQWVPVLRDFYGPFSQTLHDARDTMRNVKREEILTGISCPKCHKGELAIKFGRHGEFLACTRYSKEVSDDSCDFTSDFYRDSEGQIVLKAASAVSPSAFARATPSWAFAALSWARLLS